jgi:tetraprenyl-beta-curcumene synthase
VRELAWGLPIGSQEIGRWRSRALSIPDESIREDAISALDSKRTHAHGAGLFWIIPRRRNLHLLRLLIAYELIWDFLDNLSERAAGAGYVDGRHLHRAISDAIDPCVAISDYYHRLPWRDDGGYLRALVEACRESCARLPSYGTVRPFVLRDAHLAQVLAVNHDPEVARRDASLESWAARHFPAMRHIYWWELSGAASAPLTIHALLALAAEPGCTSDEASAAHAAYFPWLSAATTMLDSYVDRAEDLESGAHSYVSHYQDSCGTERVRELVQRSMIEAGALGRGTRHSIIAGAMVAMYLSKAAPSHAMAERRCLMRSGGSLTRLLFPIMRLWRLAYGQRHV